MCFQASTNLHNFCVVVGAAAAFVVNVLNSCIYIIFSVFPTKAFFVEYDSASTTLQHFSHIFSLALDVCSGTVTPLQL